MACQFPALVNINNASPNKCYYVSLGTDPIGILTSQAKIAFLAIILRNIDKEKRCPALSTLVPLCIHDSECSIALKSPKRHMPYC